MKTIKALVAFAAVLLAACSTPPVNNAPVDVKSIVGLGMTPSPSPPPVSASPPPAPVVVPEIPPDLPQTSSPSPMPPGVRPGIYYDDKPILLTREYLLATNKKPLVPANYILFPMKPVNEDYQNKYEFMCKLWQATFSMSEVFDQVSNPEVRAVPFYWMLTKKVQKDDCQKVVELYDYQRAKLYAIKKKLDPTKTYLVCELPDGLVTMDISGLKEENDVILAMETWIKNMRTLPKAGKQIRPYDLMTSARTVLGALGNLVAMK